MALSHTYRDLGARIALGAVALIGFGTVSLHMLTDGDCEFAPLGPSPDNARACVRAGGTWAPSTGPWHIAYEFGHIAFWPLIILIAIIIASLAARSNTPKLRVNRRSR